MLPRTRLLDPVGGTRSQDMAAGPRGTENSASSHEPRNQIVSPPIGRHPFAFNYRVPRLEGTNVSISSSRRPPIIGSTCWRGNDPKALSMDLY